MLRFMIVMSAALALTVLALYAAGLRAVPQVRPDASVSDGYTAVMVEILTRRDGSTQLASLQTIAKRSDGAIVRKLAPEGKGGRQIFFPSGLIVETNDVLRRKSTIQGPSNANSVRTGTGNSRCQPEQATEEFAGEEMIGIHRVAKYVKPAVDDRQSTSWYAMDVDCLKVRYLVQYAGLEESATHLVTIVPGPPAGALFDTSNFAEGPPSTLTNDGSKNCDADCVTRKQRRDKAYFEHRPM